MDLETQPMLPVNLPDESVPHEEVTKVLRPLIESLEKDIKKEKAENSYYAVED